MNDFPRRADFVKPLYKQKPGARRLSSATKVGKKNKLNRLFNGDQRNRFKLFIKNNSVAPNNQSSEVRQLYSVKQSIEMMEDNVKIDTEQIQSSLTNNYQSGDSNKNISFIEYPSAKEPSEEGIDHKASPIVINTNHLLNNQTLNSNNYSPLKPPRHVKLKKHRTQSCDLNINNHINYLNQPTNDFYLGHQNLRNLKSAVSIGIQVSPQPPYRLRVLPKCPQPSKSIDDLSTNEDIIYERSTGCCLCLRAQSCVHCISKIFMSQCGLGIALFVWALLGAAAFSYTEGPFESYQIARLKTVQNDLVVGLATDLRKADLLQPIWRETIEKYMSKHETLLLEAVSTGYGEGGEKHGQIWSYPGCILFAISLLTTLGFGAPVPRTVLGRSTAVVFSIIGIPLHFLLVLNVGMVLARCLQRWSSNYLPYTVNEKKSFETPLPKWLNWFPVATGICYYLVGVIGFGLLRQRMFESFLFPLDFTATGGVALTPGYMRILYGLYLEGAVMLGGIAVSLLQNSATGKMTEIGLKLGLLTNS